MVVLTMLSYYIINYNLAGMWNTKTTAKLENYL